MNQRKKFEQSKKSKEREVVKKKEKEDDEGTTDSESIPQSNEQVKVSLDKTQSDLQQKRDMGTRRQR